MPAQYSCTTSPYAAPARPRERQPIIGLPTENPVASGTTRQQSKRRARQFVPRDTDEGGALLDVVGGHRPVVPCRGRRDDAACPRGESQAALSPPVLAEQVGTDRRGRHGGLNHALSSRPDLPVRTRGAERSHGRRDPATRAPERCAGFRRCRRVMESGRVLDALGPCGVVSKPVVHAARATDGWAPASAISAAVGEIERDSPRTALRVGTTGFSYPRNSEAPVVAAWRAGFRQARAPEAPAVAVRFALRPDGSAECAGPDGQAAVCYAAYVEHEIKIRLAAALSMRFSPAARPAWHRAPAATRLGRV